MTLSFDFVAEQFDEQRGLPHEAIAAWLTCIHGLSGSRYLQVVEPGIGTGRITLPLAVAGHHVNGVDTSEPMLTMCMQRASALGVQQRVRVKNGDATALPYEDLRFDMGVIAQLLYLVPDWTTVLDELARVVRPGGHVIHLTEPTFEDNNLRLWSTTWWQMVDATGFDQIPAGPSDSDIAAEFLRRWPDTRIQEIAKWQFGQSVAEARKDYGARLRPMYPAIDQHAWDALVHKFLQWSEIAFPDSDARLDGDIVLTARIASL